MRRVFLPLDYFLLLRHHFYPFLPPHIRSHRHRTSLGGKESSTVDDSDYFSSSIASSDATTGGSPSAPASRPDGPISTTYDWWKTSSIKENIVMFLSDISGREPFYRKAFIFFSGPTPKELMNLEYFPLESE
ncbi:hypothetical protein L1887_07184 [Cichorium endivia]|nr:hypothetical protein L1887_07184 [Cichorium endivia]